MTTIQVEVWVLVDENGDYIASHDVDQLGEIYESQISADCGTAKRKVKVLLTVPLPEPVTLTGTVPAEPTEGSLQVA